MLCNATCVMHKCRKEFITKNSSSYILTENSSLSENKFSPGLSFSTVLASRYIFHQVKVKVKLRSSGPSAGIAEKAKR